jgi:flagellar basal body-associated protein FliL
MAKEKKEKEAPKTGEAGGEELQVPEKPKKRSGGGDISIVPLMGIIGGTVIFMILIVFSLYWFFIRPDIIGHKGGADSTHVEEKKELTPEEEEKLKLQQEMKKLEEEDALGETEGVLFVQTPDIITNSNPPDWYIVVQLGLEYRLPGEEGKKEEGGGHGGAAAAPTLPPKLMSEVSSFITRFFGSRSIDQITGMRDSLDKKFHEELKPVFIKNKIFLRKVSVPKFVTQRA